MRVLLTGEPGAGKTTVVRRVVEAFDPSALRGFLTEELRVGGERRGFALRPLDGSAAPSPRTLAHVDFISNQRVGRYGVDLEILNYVVDTTLREPAGRAGPAPLCVIDEVGKMECLSRRFVAAVERLVAAEVPLLATVAARGPGLIAELKKLPDAELITVTEANRDALPEQLIASLTGAGTALRPEQGARAGGSIA